MRSRPVAERLFEKIRIENDCWIWTANTIKNGYGRFQKSSKQPVLAHRAMYELLVGPIPKGMTLDHLCRNRLCVNPAHLEPCDMRTNVLRGDGPTAINARKVFCIRGHALSHNGRQRACPVCRSAYFRARYLSRVKTEAPKIPRSHCRNRHPFSPENTIVNRGRQLCRACAAQRMEKFLRRKHDTTI